MRNKYKRSKSIYGNHNNKPVDRHSFLSHLAYRWADVIEMIKHAEPDALNKINLSGLAEIALAEQRRDEFALKNSLLKFAAYLKTHLHVVYCQQALDKFFQLTWQLDHQLCVSRNNRRYLRGFFHFSARTQEGSSTLFDFRR